VRDGGVFHCPAAEAVFLNWAEAVLLQAYLRCQDGFDVGKKPANSIEREKTGFWSDFSVLVRHIFRF
jgi:hypothetical protein